MKYKYKGYCDHTDNRITQLKEERDKRQAHQAHQAHQYVSYDEIGMAPRRQLDDYTPRPHRRGDPRHRRSNNRNANASFFEATADALETIWLKVQLFAVGLLHLLFSSDSRWLAQLPPLNTPTAPAAASAASTTVTPFLPQPQPDCHAKRIIFVRHAESEWNVVFNRGRHWSALVRFVRSCVREWLLLPSPDSVFIDSPLSSRGMQQARALYADAATASATMGELDALERGPSSDRRATTTTAADLQALVLQYVSTPLPRSVVVTSNLRRAIETARIASATRLARSHEQIHVLSALQEIGRNIDTLALSDTFALTTHTHVPVSLGPAVAAVVSPGKGHSDASASDNDSDDRSDALLNVTESHGNKTIRGSSRTRLHAFAQWAMRQRDKDVLVVYGHSLWFRAFCREFFPATHALERAATQRKLANCGVASFVLEAPTMSDVRIVPESFAVIR